MCKQVDEEQFDEIFEGDLKEAVLLLTQEIHSWRYEMSCWRQLQNISELTRE